MSDPVGLTSFELQLLDIRSGRQSDCSVEVRNPYDDCTIRLVGLSGVVVSAEGSDCELALEDLRSVLESMGLRLLCNRFRRNALVSGMSRSMTGGMSCYLVRRFLPVRPEKDLVLAFGPASASDVVSAAEAARFIERWKTIVAAFPLPAAWLWFRSRRRG